jgi:F-type H+-transporting ATPase subunit epsilon
MIAATQFQLVLVTPETTLLDEPVRSVVFPLYDGQMGVLPGRAPAVGRLGTGELVLEGGSGTQRYFVDGGFVQIKGSVVSILTHSAGPIGEIDVSAAEQELDDLWKQVATSNEAYAAKQHGQERARRMISIGRRR